MIKRTHNSVLAGIKEHPERHRHTFERLRQCCTIDGAVDLSLMEAHQQHAPVGHNASPCDVSSGPCSCGAWH